MEGQVNYRQAAGGDQGTLHARLSRMATAIDFMTGGSVQLLLLV